MNKLANCLLSHWATKIARKDRVTVEKCYEINNKLGVRIVFFVMVAIESDNNVRGDLLIKNIYKCST